MPKKKLINVPRYHVFGFPQDPYDKIYLLSEAYIADDGHVQFEWNRIYKDGRTNLEGKVTFDRYFVRNTDVIDRGDFYAWMKDNNPIRYKRENWDASKPKGE